LSFSLLRLPSLRGRFSDSEAQKPEWDLVKSDYSKHSTHLKHRLVEPHYQAYDCSGAVAAIAALVQGVQTSCVSI
jgi:hypothetical protein